MTSEQLDIQHEALTEAHRKDPIASGAITAATGLVLKLAFGDGVTADNIKRHLASHLLPFPEHKELFREAFSLTSRLIGAAIRENLESKEVANA